MEKHIIVKGNRNSGLDAYCLSNNGSIQEHVINGGGNKYGDYARIFDTKNGRPLALAEYRETWEYSQPRENPYRWSIFSVAVWTMRNEQRAADR